MHSSAITSLLCSYPCCARVACFEERHTRSQNPTGNSDEEVVCITCEKSHSHQSTKTKYTFQLVWRFCLTFRNKTPSLCVCACLVSIAIHANSPAYTLNGYCTLFVARMLCCCCCRSSSVARGTQNNGGICCADTEIRSTEKQKM